MPKSNLDKFDIPRFYQKTALEYIVFGWVKGQREIDPNITITQSCFNLVENLGIADTFDPSFLETLYYDTQKLFLNKNNINTENGKSNKNNRKAKI